jgi:hypothetical protein
VVGGQVTDGKKVKSIVFFWALIVFIGEYSIPRPLDQAYSFLAPSPREINELTSPQHVELP